MLQSDVENEAKSTDWNTQVFEHIYQKAQAGEAPWQFQMGMFFSGEGGIVAANPKKQAEWYSKAASKGHAGAMNNLGLMYEKGIGVEKSGERAFDLFNQTLDCQPLEQDSISIAQFNIGRCYEYGIGVVKNFGKAFEWYVAAADLGHQNANNKCGFFLSKGLAGPEDKQRAFQYFKKAAELGHLHSTYLVGLYLHLGIGTNKDDSFIDWYLKAADRGHAQANLELAELYEKGRKVHADHNQALHYLNRAANFGNGEAQYRLYEELSNNTICDSNVERLRTLLERSAASGFKYAIYKLVRFLIKGKLFRKDIGRAMKLIETPVLQGDQIAYGIFSNIDKGDLTAGQKNKHRQITKMSADLFNPSAAYDLAQEYEKEGDTDSSEEALRYYSRAAALGLYGAALDLARCFQFGIGCDEPCPREAAAIYYHHAFVRKTHGHSHVVKLAEFFANGIAVPKNYVFAYALSNFAGTDGDEHAISLRDSLETKMSHDQIGRAQDMTVEWGDLSDAKDYKFFPDWMREPPEYTQLEAEAKAKEQKDPESGARAAKALLMILEGTDTNTSK